MSENLEELLNVDEENEGDYDLGDAEEEALLDENYDIANQTQLPSVTNIQTNKEIEQDVLDLDDETELNDEDNENLNSTVEEEEERRRQDKFSSERIVPQQEKEVIAQKKFRIVQGKQNFRGGFNRNRRGGTRGNFHNNQNRTGLFQQRSKVLINPHFKGNVYIKDNVSLAWDKNNGSNEQKRKPVIQISPWAKTVNPDTSAYQQHQVQPNMYMNQQYQAPFQNSRLPVHQRLGISSNTYSQPIPENQLAYIQNFQQPAYPQIIAQNQTIPQNPICNQIQYPNHYNNANQFVQPAFNNNISNNHVSVMNKPINPQFENQWNINQNQQMQPVNFPPNQNYSNYSLQVPPHQYVQTYHNNNSNNNNNDFNNLVPNIGNYPQNLPVVNNQAVNVDVPYYEESKMQFQRIRTHSGGSPTKRKFDFKGDMKKKKRTVLSSNLHEVKTVDLSTIMPEEDEEMKEYRQKIAHQKIIREKLVRQKEERRKQAAIKLQAEQQYKSLLTPTDIVKEEIPVIMNSKETVQSIVAQSAKPITKTSFGRVNQTIVPIKTVDNPLTIKRVVSTKPLSCENVSAGNSESETLNKDQLSSFLSNRKIFAKDNSLADTSLVVVNNLATGTSEVKLRKLCQGMGDIQTLQISTKERQATIQFKSVASAHAFYKKYQRFMLDLSMIQVTLKPHS